MKYSTQANNHWAICATAKINKYSTGNCPIVQLQGNNNSINTVNVSSINIVQINIKLKPTLL